jgi:hypothetical protein
MSSALRSGEINDKRRRGNLEADMLLLLIVFKRRAVVYHSDARQTSSIH